MEKLIFDLQLFAEGGEAAPGAVGSGETPAAAGQTGSDAQTAQTSPEAEERAKAYAQFKADYKSEYDAEVQSIVKDRLKKPNSKIAELNGQLKSHDALLKAVANRYGVDVNNIEAMTNAFLYDNAHLEQEAYDKGMTVEQLKAFRTIERENEKLRAAEAQRAELAQYAEWDRQAEELKQVYPGFDIEAEMQNEQFRRMMTAGVDVRNCYEIVHKDEIMRGAMQFTAQRAAEKVTNAVIANKARPLENGLSSKSGSVAKTNIASLSREQMEQIKLQAAAGKRITFKD